MGLCFSCLGAVDPRRKEEKKLASQSEFLARYCDRAEARQVESEDRIRGVPARAHQQAMAQRSANSNANQF